MKHVYYFILIVIFIASCNTRKCKNYHTGSFSMNIENMDVDVFRDKEYQYEYYEEDSVKFRITWLNDCQYSLRLLETSIDRELGFLDTLISTKITKTFPSGYEFESVGNSTSVILKGTMGIIP